MLPILPFLVAVAPAWHASASAEGRRHRPRSSNWSSSAQARGSGVARAKAPPGQQPATPTCGRQDEGQRRPRLPPLARRHPGHLAAIRDKAARRSRANSRGSAARRSRDPATRACGGSCCSPSACWCSATASSRLYWTMTRGWRKHVLAMPLDTVEQRLAVVGLRLGYNLLWLLELRCWAAWARCCCSTGRPCSRPS